MTRGLPVASPRLGRAPGLAPPLVGVTEPGPPRSRCGSGRRCGDTHIVGIGPNARATSCRGSGFADANRFNPENAEIRDTAWRQTPLRKTEPPAGSARPWSLTLHRNWVRVTSIMSRTTQRAECSPRGGKRRSGIACKPGPLSPPADPDHLALSGRRRTSPSILDHGVS